MDDVVVVIAEEASDMWVSLVGDLYPTEASDAEMMAFQSTNCCCCCCSCGDGGW